MSSVRWGVVGPGRIAARVVRDFVHLPDAEAVAVASRSAERAVAFADLGGDYLDRVDKHRTAKRLIRRLDALGYDVMLRPKAAG